MFGLNESLEINTKKLCTLQEASERTANAIQLMIYVFAGLLAFGFLDRITGDWTVVNTEWMVDFYENTVKGPYMWLLFSIITWFLMGALIHYLWSRKNRTAQGITTLRISYNRKVHAKRLQDFLLTKTYTFEDYAVDPMNEIVRTTYEDQDKELWGGSKPKITLEYDRKNEFMLYVTIWYNRLMAKPDLVLSADELQTRIEKEFEDQKLWNDEEFELQNRKEDLAVDKRKIIEEQIKADEEDEDEGDEED